MCGISGTLGLADAVVVRAMNDAMAHRGPDDQGVYVDEHVGCALAHRRLAIIDTGAGGRQPMASADGRLQVVYNGEIYNYRALREELERAGVRFTTHSDTEVLLCAYQRWGPQCVDRFDGMFAFAILDRRSTRTRLFLARDRFGIKPLYYCIVNGVFLFASELKGLLASGRVAREVEPRAVWHYLATGSVAQPHTLIRSVRALMPGHWLEVSDTLELRHHRWWDLVERAPWRDPAFASMDANEGRDRLRGLLEEATRRHLVSDVEVGAFLSGGIDSSAVVAMMARVRRAPIKTFTVTVEGVAASQADRDAAALVATRHGCDHHEITVTGEAVARDYDALLDALDQPSVDGTNTWLVSRAAGQSVKVALSGLGGDELFAGYRHFHTLRRVERLGRWLRPAAARRLAPVLRRLVPDLPLPLLARERWARYTTLRDLAGAVGVAALCGPGLGVPGRHEDLAAFYRARHRPELDAVQEAVHMEVSGYLPNTLLRDADATAMAASLEVRPVLLDHHLAEFAFALPVHLKLCATRNKPLLAAAVSDLLPTEVIHRPKVGFELPLQEWLGGPLRDRARDAFSSDTAGALFSPVLLRQMRQVLDAGRGASLAVWSRLTLVEWLRAHRCGLSS